jgi:hypothetical protein
LIFLAFVVPLAIYCLFLALINRSRHPIVIWGPWDFAGVLFAASGFLLVGGPAILTGLYEHWRLSWLLGQTRFLQSLDTKWHFWLGVWGLYFAVLVTGLAFVLWRRRNQISIYNVEHDAFEEILPGALDRLGFRTKWSGPRRVLISRREDEPGTAMSHSAGPANHAADHAVAGAAPVAPDAATPDGEWVEVHLDVAPAMRHVTVHWPCELTSIRQDAEVELAKALRGMRSVPNPASGWFLALSLSMFLAVIFGMGTLFVLTLAHLP